jgi:hypothetical protein
MPTHPEQPSPGLSAHSHLLALLMTLPPESVRVVEQFVQFLSAQAQQGQPIAIMAEHEAHMSCRYPTIPVPAAMLNGLIGMVPPVGGDALADTEALYDEV